MMGFVYARLNLPCGSNEWTRFPLKKSVLIRAVRYIRV